MALPRSLFALLAPLLLTLPTPASASTQADPIYDETWSPGRAVHVPTTCHDGRVDLREVSMTRSGQDATLSIRVRDFDDIPTCAGLTGVQARDGFWQFAAQDATGAARIFAYASEWNGVVTFHYQVGSGGADVSGPHVGSVQGDVLTWTIPLAGAIPGTQTPYDYRGLAFSAHVHATEWIDPPAVPRLGWTSVLSLYDEARIQNATM